MFSLLNNFCKICRLIYLKLFLKLVILEERATTGVQDNNKSNDVFKLYL